MRIGLTYDAVPEWAAAGLDAEALAEFDSEATIAAIALFLVRRGHDVERIGRAQALVGRLAAGARWDIVFNICEGRHGFAREALVPALLEAWEIPVTFSDAVTCALTLHKGHTKRVIRDAGIATAPFVLLADANGDLPLDCPVFVKPAGEGTGKGIGPASLCRTQAQARTRVADVIARFGPPALVESYLPGREFTVGVVGGAAVGVMEIQGADIYGFEVKKYATTVRQRLVDYPAARDLALAAWQVLGCRDGGRVDLRCDACGRPMFLEANPLPGLHPVDSDLTILVRLAGHDHDWLLDGIMRSACARAGLPW